MGNVTLDGKRIAILATDGFEQSELFDPLKALEAAGAEVHIISMHKGEIKAWNKKNWGKSIEVDLTVDEALIEDYDGLVLPGGVMNPDQLRDDSASVDFVRSFAESGRPMAAICHGPWVLINAKVVKGRHLTSYSSIRMDLENAGAHWVDEEVVVDHGLVTSRSPKDLPAFIGKMIEEFAEGPHHTRISSGKRQHSALHH